MAWFGVDDLTKFSIVAYGEICQAGWLQTGSGNRAVDVGYFFTNLLHLEVHLELESMAWFGVVDLTKFSIVA